MAPGNEVLTHSNLNRDTSQQLPFRTAEVGVTVQGDQNSPETSEEINPA